jgi:hypothetical protein
MRPNGVRTRVPSIEWRGASDCFPSPRTFVLAPPDRRMVAIRIGNSDLLHSISPHARPSVLPNSIVCTMFLASFVLYVCCHILWRRTTRLISALLISVGVSYILGATCTVLSALTALHLAGIRVPINWNIVVAQAFEPTIVLIAWSSLYFGI